MNPRLPAALAVALLAACAHAPSTSTPPSPTTSATARAAAPRAAVRVQLENGLATNWNGPNGLDNNGLGSNWNGPNGVHPGPMGVGTIDSADFAKWFAADPAAAAKAMTYFVRCAYADGTEIRWTDPANKLWTWPGRIGLAQATFLANQRMSADEGKWVSACLMAHVNTQGTHQYISLRGNPPGAEAQAALAPTDAERWTMDYAEAVFSGDTYRGAASGGWTFGLDLPPAYDDGSAVWQPQGPVLGRTLDFDGWRPAGWDHPYVTIVGPYQTNRSRFSMSGGTVVDPDYPYDTDCVGPQAGPGCGPTFSPLFVHEARLANFESAARPGSGAPPMMQVLDVGTTRIDPGQATACPEQHACVGVRPAGGGKPGPGAKLTGLRAGQKVEAVLRLTQKQQHAGVKPPPPGQRFTAIVRYAAAQPATVHVTALGADGKPTLDRDVQLPATGGSDVYEWLQVYPVEATPSEPGSPLPALRLALSGVAAPPGGTAPPAPELDAVGFVPGRPWCTGDVDAYAGNCPR